MGVARWAWSIPAAPPGAMQAEELTYLAVLGASIPAGVLFHGGGEMGGEVGGQAVLGRQAL